MPRPLAVVFALSVGSAFAIACGSPKATDFLTAEADSTGKGGSGSSQGGSATGGGGGSPGGSPATGGVTGGSPTGGLAGMSTGGTPTGGTSGSSGSASGGTDTGGSGGSGGGEIGGSSGSGGGTSDCDAAVMHAEAALREARACNPNSGGMLCTGSVQDLCGCTVPVEKQDSEETKAYLALREAALRCGVACPAIPCAEPTVKTVCFLGDSASCIYLR